MSVLINEKDAAFLFIGNEQEEMAPKALYGRRYRIQGFSGGNLQDIVQVLDRKEVYAWPETSGMPRLRRKGLLGIPAPGRK